MGGQNRPKMGQVGLKTALETTFFQKSEFSRNHLKINEKAINMSPRAATNGPRSPQDGSKTVLNTDLFRIDFCLRFWFVLGPFLAPFGRPFGSPNRSFLASIFHSLLHVGPRAAKSGPRAAKGGPRAAKSGLRAP